MDDLISRQASINKCQERLYESALNNVGYECKADEVFEDIAQNRIKTWLNEVPSAQQWIPCSERLPKKGRYLVTGKKNRDWYTSDKIVTSAFYDGEFWTDNGDIQAEAWMPLPEPYKGEKP